MKHITNTKHFTYSLIKQQFFYVNKNIHIKRNGHFAAIIFDLGCTFIAILVVFFKCSESRWRLWSCLLIFIVTLCRHAHVYYFLYLCHVVGICYVYQICFICFIMSAFVFQNYLSFYFLHQVGDCF